MFDLPTIPGLVLPRHCKVGRREQCLDRRVRHLSICTHPDCVRRAALYRGIALACGVTPVPQPAQQETDRAQD